MSADSKTVPNTQGASAVRPLIPETFWDVPSQRLYILSLGALCQAIKLFDFFRSPFGSEDNQASYCRKWLIADCLFCIFLARLRLPRLNYSKPVVALQIISFWLLDGLLFGGIILNVGGSHTWASALSTGFSNRGAVISTPQPSGFSSILSSLGLGFLMGSAGNRDQHLLGQHTVRMSPISTAQLNPHGQTFCLSNSGDSVLIPILLNNTNPSNIRYSLVPLGYVEDAFEQDKSKSSQGKIESIELSTKELKAIEQTWLESLQVARAVSKRSPDEDDEYTEYDEYDDDDDDEELSISRLLPPLQKTQSLTHIRLNKPGKLRLERVVDSSSVDARLIFAREVVVVPCPRVEFAADTARTQVEDVRCAIPGLASGAGEELDLEINVYGVPPLSLRWYREVNGRRESFMVEGIENSGHEHRRSEGDQIALTTSGASRAPAELKIPLAVSLDSPGTHSYTLESVSDALGNIMQAGSNTATNQRNVSQQSKTHRTVKVLRRPAVSFKNCGPGNPASLLVDSDTPLTISAKDADSLDAPWDIEIMYQPPVGSRKVKPWTKQMQTQHDSKELIMRASAPGEYSIVGVKGKYCEGDILSPETCKVVERPKPTAEVEWKKIHECSGDTGVSASLVLHGTPPFQVVYRMQRDKEPAKDVPRTFATSRGEITIQPERSGHYVFQIVQISDANYKKVPLQGPSIKQVVHPPASAEFANNMPGGRGKKQINSCSGSMVDVDVDLRGTGPWTLEVQIVGSKGSEIVRVPDIKTPRTTLHLPIPKSIDKEGGSFEIDLASVEDAYGCKRSLSAPGIVVNVRRVQPTARFYGKKEQRQITKLDNEEATLPLRLTGDGPWRLTYRRAEEPDRKLTAMLNTPNDELRIKEKGLYEILEVADSQCPGTIITNEATYRVDHIPRPSAKLSPQIQSIYEPFNGSHILPPICEGMNDHVNLELSGRPPFQIMYNVASGNEMGGTKILDQPTFSSIQPRTSFQLHTSEAARIYYEVKQIGDMAYPLEKNRNAVIPRSERLVFEQQVLKRPSARFNTLNGISYCLNEALLPHDSSSHDGVIMLEGTPPFQLQLSIRDFATNEIHTALVETPDALWRLSVPAYTFRSIGRHLVSIESVQDASGCAQVTPDPTSRSIMAEVLETAAIVPFDRREHFCVGDAIQFQLEGTPPWTIGYRINGKTHTQQASLSPFSIVQQQPGEFTIASIAHQQKMCQTAVTDLRYAVHELPAAQVGHGKRIVQDIHEGDQAEIVFTLAGEPPFTFTYQRAELSPKKGARGKVLETHTVSGVTTREYSVFSALEGTWTVTFIADRYCRYPPVQVDGMLEK